jgi:hypothetical protein
MQNGHFIAIVGGAYLREIDLAGNTIRDLTPAAVNTSLQSNGYSFTVSDFHHDVATLPNGHWVVICHTNKDFTNLPGYPGTTNVAGDALLDIDLNGNVVWAWSAFDHLDVNRHPLGLLDFQGLGGDWTHSNAIVYMEDGNLLLSMRNQNWLLKIDYQNGTGPGDILWRLGEEGDFSLAGETNPNQWFYAQHYPSLLADNGSETKLAIWDNGDNRLDSNDQPCGTTTLCYSRATIFDVDQNAKVARLLWEDLPGFYSYWGGSIGVLSNGDVEFDQTIPFNSVASRITEVTQGDIPQTVWQLDLTGENAYRAYRIPSLYPGVTWQK